MNEKIKELALRSGALYSKTSDNQVEYLDHRNCIFDEIKFAELIICDVLKNVWDEVQYSTSQGIANEIDEKLKTYYGVK